MKARIMLVAGAAVLAVAGCATGLSDGERQARAERMLKEGFSKGNQAMAARVVQQDEAQALCSKYARALPKDVVAKIEQSQQATIKYPADGKLMGDWKEGEKIAQDGWGLRFTDTSQPDRKNGGNCYACHQLAPQELSYGTLGPSLYQFGKSRGYTDDVRKYVYGKIYNAEAYSACTSMPRFGHSGVLTEQQIKDVVALLMDPNSPVNK
jgi:sulfur-oxidizing protein SoxX